MQEGDLENRFMYHAPDEVKVQRHAAVRAQCYELACSLDVLCGDDGREKSLVMTHLEDVMMWANAAIARSD